MKRKVLISLSMAMIFAVMMIIPAAASSGAEEIIAEIEMLRAKYSSNAEAVSYANQAIIWLKNPDNAATITSEDAAAVSAQISAALATAGDAKSLADLSEADYNSIMSNIHAAAKAVGVQLEGDPRTGSFRLKDSGGNTIITGGDNNPIKQTGFDISTFIMITISSLAVLFIVYITLLTLKKKRAYSKNAIRKPRVQQ